MSRAPDHPPPFAVAFVRDAVGGNWIAVRHQTERHRWRFDVAEKNGRRQLIHHSHKAAEGAQRGIEDLALDAYDFATLEARGLGMVD